MIRHSLSRHRRWALVAMSAVVVGAGVLGRASAQESSHLAEAHAAAGQAKASDRIARDEALQQQRGWSGPLLVDLGGAYQREGRLGYAILSYERAALLTPRDPSLAANLATARVAAGLPAEPAPLYRRIGQRLSPREWSGLTLAALWLACLALAIARLAPAPSRRRLGRRVASAAIVAGLLSAVTLVLVSPRRDDAIVVSRGDASLRLSPFADAAVEASVAEGAHVVVTARHDGFVRVRDGQGHAGWTDAAAVEPLVGWRS